MSKSICGEYFYGNKVSDYGLKHGYVDYGTLAKACDITVLNNNIFEKVQEYGGYWDKFSGNEYHYEDLYGNIYTPSERDKYINELNNEIDELESKILEFKGDKEEKYIQDIEKITEYYHDIFQYYIISNRGAEILAEYTNEIVFYNEEFDIYLWGVTYCGTSWDYVLTDIKCNIKED